MSTKTKLKWKPNTQVVDLSLIDDPLAKQKHELVNKSVDILTTEILQDSKYKKQVNFFKQIMLHLMLTVFLNLKVIS